MKKFLALFYNKEMPAPSNPKEAEELMKPWNEYLFALWQKGHLDGGLPVMRSGKELEKSANVKDYKAGEIDVGGFLLLNASDMAEAVKLVKESPFGKNHMGNAIIRECMSMM